MQQAWRKVAGILAACLIPVAALQASPLAAYALDPPGPVAVDDTYSVAQNGTLTVPAAGVLSNDTDSGGSPLTAALARGPSHGTLTLNPDGSFTYTPTPGYEGADEFTYMANSPDNESNVATVTISVTHGNHPPVANNDQYCTPAGTDLTVPAANGVLANDTDADGQTLLAHVMTRPVHGGLEILEDGSFTYYPDPGYTGTDTFTYADNDGTDSSNVATVTIAVATCNHAPVAVNDAYAVIQGHTLTVPAGGVLTNDTDADGDALTTSPMTGPSHGTLTLNADGSFVYTPAPGFAGTDTFTYVAEDGKAFSGPATVTITVGEAPPPPPPPPPPPVHINHQPTANNDSYAVNEDATLTVSGSGVVSNDIDPDGDSLSATLVSNPAHGTVALSAHGDFVYTPAPLFYGTDMFTYRVSDGALSSNVATVMIAVNRINHAPQAVNDAYGTVEGEKLTVPAGGILGNDLDLDGDSITPVLVSATHHGTLGFKADGGFSYLPDPGFTGEDSFVYKLSDGQLESNQARVTITVRPGIVPVRSVLQGTVTDAVTGKAIANAQVSLFWADTPLDQQQGHKAGDAVASQETTARGAFSWQLAANADYYITVSMNGYVTFDSRMRGNIHVGADPVTYDVQLQPIHRRFLVGYPDGTFKPDQSVTRAEVAAIFARIVQPTKVELPPPPFADVSAGYWASTYIELVREKGLMVGGPDGSFRPDDLITRAELAQIIVRFRGLTPIAQGPFSDTAGHWAEQAINAAYTAGLITGYPDNTFRPAALTTRAEAATMINRLLGRGPLTGRLAPSWPDVPFDHWASGQVEEASSSHTADGAPGGGEHWTSDTHEATW